jgi:hypothetical protein
VKQDDDVEVGELVVDIYDKKIEVSLNEEKLEKETEEEERLNNEKDEEEKEKLKRSTATEKNLTLDEKFDNQEGIIFVIYFCCNIYFEFI